MCTDLDLSNIDEMKSLQSALAAKGLHTQIADAGSGINVLSLVLLADNGKEALTVTALSVNRQCEIGTSGFRQVNGKRVLCGSVEFVYPTTIELAVDVFELYWADRDCFIRDMRQGRCDLE